MCIGLVLRQYNFYLKLIAFISWCCALYLKVNKVISLVNNVYYLKTQIKDVKRKIDILKKKAKDANDKAKTIEIDIMKI
jgi:hypothetical protein